MRYDRSPDGGYRSQSSSFPFPCSVKLPQCRCRPVFAIEAIADGIDATVDGGLIKQFEEREFIFRMHSKNVIHVHSDNYDYIARLLTESVVKNELSPL